MSNDQANLTLDIFVHLDAVGRDGWEGDGDERPLTELGQAQAAWLAANVSSVDGLFSSPARRCRDSLESLGQATGQSVVVVPELRETRGNRAPDGWARGEGGGPDPLGGAVSAGSAAMGLRRIREAVPAGRVVVCSYGDIIPVLLAYLAGAYQIELPPRVDKRGSFYTVELSGNTVTLSSREPAADFPT